MSAMDGAGVELRLGDAGLPVESFTAIGGVQVTQLSVSQRMPASTGVLSAGWRTMKAGMGERSVRLRAEGVLTDSATEATLRGLALGLGVRNVELAFPSGERWRGAFAVSAYERRAGRDAPVSAAFTLESAGAVTVV